jgi:hypothetical protein
MDYYRKRDIKQSPLFVIHRNQLHFEGSSYIGQAGSRMSRPGGGGREKLFGYGICRILI